MKLLALLPIAIVLIAGCTSSPPVTGGDTNPSPPSPPAAPEPAPPPSAAQVREFTITARQFQFNPSTITVNKGDRVKLTVTSEDVTHGFSISEYNINKVLQPNTPVIVEFTADQAGTFTMFCSVTCGSGHSGMRGTLVVEE